MCQPPPRPPQPTRQQAAACGSGIEGASSRVDCSLSCRLLCTLPVASRTPTNVEPGAIDALLALEHNFGRERWQQAPHVHRQVVAVVWCLLASARLASCSSGHTAAAAAADDSARLPLFACSLQARGAAPPCRPLRCPAVPARRSASKRHARCCWRRAARPSRAFCCFRSSTCRAAARAAASRPSSPLEAAAVAQAVEAAAAARARPAP